MRVDDKTDHWAFHGILDSGYQIEGNILTGGAIISRSSHQPCLVHVDIDVALPIRYYRGVPYNVLWFVFVSCNNEVACIV